jgi:hypothetical protein
MVSRVANTGTRTRVFSHQREALAEQVLKAYGLKRDPGHSAQATLQATLRDVLDGKSDLSKQLPFDRRPSASKNREGVLAELVKSANNTALGRTFRQQGWDLKSFLGEQLTAAQQVDIADGVLARAVKRDVQTPRVKEQPSRETTSRERLRAALSAKVDAMEATKPPKRIRIDTPMELHVRSAMNAAEGKTPQDFAAEHSVPQDIKEHVLEHSEWGDAPDATLRDAVETSYEQQQG